MKDSDFITDYLLVLGREFLSLKFHLLKLYRIDQEEAFNVLSTLLEYKKDKERPLSPRYAQAIIRNCLLQRKLKEMPRVAVDYDLIRKDEGEEDEKPNFKELIDQISPFERVLLLSKITDSYFRSEPNEKERLKMLSERSKYMRKLRCKIKNLKSFREL